MRSSCNLHDDHVSVVYVHRGCTQHNWAGMSSHVEFYMILIYDVRIMIWPGQISLDLFRDLQVVRSNSQLVCLSSAGHVPRGGMTLLSTRSCCFIDRDLRDRVNLVGRGFEPRTEQYDFYWSWVQFPAQIACFRPVWSVAYVTRPHKWWIRVMWKKNLIGGKKP